ncbi:NPCBM/NEW2 domain-containing protein [Pedobacter xixiisoli]|uniref:Alpha-galactosidase n=1 Tax=Pedobacter xixiisoli TaxID=1476464 RepID=A0A285ZS99_9SPHI|nr:NPCBM/NEW2 domain-containing protein [Pedobacter xixiisoli]SOD12509.1 alpha-galactosidase [Pedobacter xixiisoli]
MFSHQKFKLLIYSVLFTFCVGSVKANVIDSLWFHQADFTKANDLFVGPGKLPRKLAVAGKNYETGLASPEGLVTIELKKGGLRMQGLVGMDDNVPKGGVRFVIMGDRKELFKTDIIRKGAALVPFDVSLANVEKLYLIVENDGDGIHTAHANWINTVITYQGLRPVILPKAAFVPYILTPKASAKPKINGAKVYGARPGNPFLYLIAASGQRPMTFKATNLPKGLKLDVNKGIISGALATVGTTEVILTATNSLGSASRVLKIVGGEEISLTPAMGWNSWNCFADAVSADKVKDAADAMINSGLTQHGWNYINIDDCWEIKPDSKDPLLMGEVRDANGMINSNKKFPDMNQLTDYLHAQGLKAGIYSSPGETTCGGYAASYGYEAKDTQRWAEWGFDYVKYDWCSYYKIYDKLENPPLAELQKPYQLIGDGLKNVKRDIVFSLCQYGMGDVGKWGKSVGGNSWRISRDVHDTWASMSGIGFAQAGREVDAKPGHWNDSDMLVIGMVGWGPKLRPTRLSADEQYTHVSLWSLLTTPLLIGCDMTKMDDFTLNLLTNDEVIDINQDPLGKQASRVYVNGKLEIWMKDLEDGSKAIGLFNRGIFPEKIKADWKAIGVNGKQLVRDAWRQKDLGVFEQNFETELPAHGVRLVVLKAKK